MNIEYSFIDWTKSKVRTIICNKTYTGSVQWNRRGGRRNPKVNEQKDIISALKFPENEIVADNDWERCSKIRKERDETKDAHILDTPFILRNKLVCAGCDKVMKSKNLGKKKGLVYYCDTPNCLNRNGNYRVTIPKDIVEDEFNRKISDMFKIQDFEAIQNRYYEMNKKDHKECEEMIEQLKKLIGEARETISKIEFRLVELKDEKDAYIRKALETRRVVEGTAIEEYEKVLAMLERRINQEEIERDKLEGILEMFPHYLKTLSVPKEHPAYEEVRRYKRIFVLFAIDRVEVDYNRKNKWMDMVIRCNFSWEV